MPTKPSPMELDPVAYFTRDVPVDLVPLVETVAENILPTAPDFDISGARAEVEKVVQEKQGEGTPLTVTALDVTNIALAARIRAQERLPKVKKVKKGRTK